MAELPIKSAGNGQNSCHFALLLPTFTLYGSNYHKYKIAGADANE
jgi:hypothetical protein